MKYKVILFFEDEQIQDVTDELFETREAAALFGLGCLRAYRFIAKATERLYEGYCPFDADAVVGFEVVETECIEDRKELSELVTILNKRAISLSKGR